MAGSDPLRADPAAIAAARALSEADPAVAISLVVPPDAVPAETDGLGRLPATTALTATDDLAAVRADRSASVRVAAKEARDGRADVWVATGPPRPALAAARFTLGLLPGATAPVIATPLASGLVLVAGDGAAEEPVAGLLGGVVATRLLGIPAPRVTRLADVSAAILLLGSHDVDVVTTDPATARAALELMGATAPVAPSLVLGLTALTVIAPTAGADARPERHGELARLAVTAVRARLVAHATAALATLVSRRRDAAGLPPGGG